MQRYLAMCLLMSPIIVRGAELSVVTSPADAAQIQCWVRDLGDEGFEVRLSAEENLRKAGASALNALQSAEKSGDAEVHHRVGQLLGPLYERMEWTWVRESLGAPFGAVVNPPVSTTDAVASAAPPEGPPADDAALDWLARAQEADGHWDSCKYGAAKNADIEQTALALLAFLSCGHTEKVGAYKTNVRLAISWLAKHVRTDGVILGAGAQEVDGLVQSVAGLALAEAAGMGNIKETRDLAQRMVDCSTRKIVGIEIGRERKSNALDLMTTTFYVLQLKSAKVAGLNIPKEDFEGVIQVLDEGGKCNAFGFAPGRRCCARATIMGCLCRHNLGWKREELFDKERNAFDAYGDPGGPSADDLTNYIGKMVALYARGDIWIQFNGAVNDAVRLSQCRDGANAGSWNPRGDWAGAGRVFSTAVNVLSLQICRRWW